MKNMEIEVKYRIKNIDDLEKKIVELGAEYLGEVIESDFYYNHPCKDFSKTDEAIRIRKYERGILLTYKGPRKKSDYKIREEIETIVDENIFDILKKLNFKEIANIIKRRKKYRIWNVNILLDHVENLGNFIELEIFDENYLQNIEKLVNILDLKEKENKTYLELFIGDKNEL
ncbi:MAG: class IV adenylate cyclase [Thermoplasmata archaeon]